MPEMTLGDACCGMGNSAASTAFGPVSTCIHPEFLFEEFALLLPRREGPTAALVVKRDASGESTQRTCEVFADINYLREMQSVPASEECLEQTGLRDIFGPDEDRAVYPLWLKGDCGPSGLLLVKARLGCDPEEFRRTGEEQELALKYLLLSVRDAVRGYDAIIMKHVLEHRRPCMVVDAQRRVMSVNRPLSDVVGLDSTEMIGADLESILKFDVESCVGAGALEHGIVTTPVFVIPLSILITANVEVQSIGTPCGARTLFAFDNLRSEDAPAGPDFGLLHRFSELALSEAPPAEVICKMLASLASGLSSNLVCVVRQSSESELVVTPYSTRRVHSLGVRVLSLEEDPVLRPFFECGRPVACQDVREACGEISFFRRALSISAFVLVPIKDGEPDRNALLIAWQGDTPDGIVQKMIMLTSMANILGTVLKRCQVLADLEHERQSRRRYTKLVAGREVRMAELKRENAKLKDLVVELSNRISEQEEA